MLFLWFAPPSVVSPPKRGDTLVWLDVLGKWSMIDIFVLVMSMVAFRLHIISPPPSAVALLPDNFYMVDLLVTPVWCVRITVMVTVVRRSSLYSSTMGY